MVVGDFVKGMLDSAFCGDIDNLVSSFVNVDGVLDYAPQIRKMETRIEG